MHLYRMFNNRLYIGEIAHYDQHYPGEHEAIVPRALFDQVQAILEQNCRVRGNNARAKTPAMLKGILRCGHCGTSMGATFARKNGKMYRYYLCLRARKSGYDEFPVRTLPAGDIEALVVSQVRRVLQTPEMVARVCRVAREASESPTCDDGTGPPTDADVISRLALWDGAMSRRTGQDRELGDQGSCRLGRSPGPDVSHDRGIAALADEVSGSSDIEPGESLSLNIDFSTRQYGGRKQIILPDGTSLIDPANTVPDTRAVAIARAHAWMEAMETGRFRNLSELAQVVGVDEGYVRRQLDNLLKNFIKT